MKKTLLLLSCLFFGLFFNVAQAAMIISHNLEDGNYKITGSDVFKASIGVYGDINESNSIQQGYPILPSVYCAGYDSTGRNMLYLHYKLYKDDK